jgi:hypothetical protein
MVIRRSAVVIVILLVATSLLAQSLVFSRITESQAREAVKSAAALHPRDPEAFRREAEKRLQGIAPDFSMAYMVPLISTPAIEVRMIGPATVLLANAWGKVRRMEPVGDELWFGGIAIGVEPKQIGAPDIVRVVVERAGVLIEPITVTLKPTVFTTRMGVKEQIHAGTVLFPADAFDPGGDVVVTVIPQRGANTIRKLTESELRRLQ